MKAQEHKDYIRPGRVFGNLWFVGLRSASTHIIDTGEGLILIDPGFGETLWIVRENIRELGFDEKDIRIILMTHGHYDHAGATAELVRLTGAKTCIGKEDLAMVTGREDSSLAELFGVTFTDFFTPDVLLSDGDHVTLGNTDILCLSTPGHTDGTMSYFFRVTDGERSFLAGMHGGVGTNTLTGEFLRSRGLPFSNREKFVRGLRHAMEQPVEIFLGNHVGNNRTEEKLARVAAGETLAFYAPEEWIPFLEGRIRYLGQIVEKENHMDKTIQTILEEKIIVILRGVPREKLIPFAEAAYRGGIRLIECTYDATGTVSDEQTAENIRLLAEHMQGRMQIGAGTVLTNRQVELTKAAGGRFIISPNVDPAVIRRTKAEGMVSIPGALTPSEAVVAHNAGADFVKLFPVGCMGARYLKDVRSPLSHIRFLAVGGVNADNMEEYLKAGACGFGIGSDIVNKKMLAENDFAGIEALAAGYTRVVAAFNEK